MLRNSFKILSSALLLNILNLKECNSYELLPDIDYFGGDMYTIYNINSSLLCMNHCESIRDCKLATWCDNNCYVKNVKTQPSEKIGCVTVDMYPEDTSGSNMENGSNNGNESMIGDMVGDSVDEATLQPVTEKVDIGSNVGTQVENKCSALSHVTAVICCIISVFFLS